MNYNQIFEQNGPSFYVIGLAADEVMALRRDLAQAFPATTIRVIRGDKSTNEEAFFNEAGAALQFPGDFVELWENFGACLNDLNWLPGGPLLLLFSYAPYLLCDEPPVVFGELIEQLAKTATNRPAGQFKVLFQVSPDDMAAYLDRLASTGKKFRVLTT